uniref:Putative secreted protein n=1 Tax=Ixodes ricinus TaxID=34613 RepID=A0A6B0URQ8_IXORI
MGSAMTVWIGEAVLVGMGGSWWLPSSGFWASGNGVAYTRAPQSRSQAQQLNGGFLAILVGRLRVTESLAMICVMPCCWEGAGRPSRFIGARERPFHRIQSARKFGHRRAGTARHCHQQRVVTGQGCSHRRGLP